MDPLTYLKRLGWQWREDGVVIKVATSAGERSVFIPLSNVWITFDREMSAVGCPLPAAVGAHYSVGGLFAAIGAYPAHANTPERRAKYDAYQAYLAKKTPMAGRPVSAANTALRAAAKPSSAATHAKRMLADQAKRKAAMAAATKRLQQSATSGRIAAGKRKADAKVAEANRAYQARVAASRSKGLWGAVTSAAGSLYNTAASVVKDPIGAAKSVYNTAERYGGKFVEAAGTVVRSPYFRGALVAASFAVPALAPVAGAVEAVNQAYNYYETGKKAAEDIKAGYETAENVAKVVRGIDTGKAVADIIGKAQGGDPRARMFVGAMQQRLVNQERSLPGGQQALAQAMALMGRRA